MQNDDKALPIIFVTKPSHRFAFLCLDNVKLYKNTLLYGTCFITAILKHSVQLLKHCFH